MKGKIMVFLVGAAVAFVLALLFFPDPDESGSQGFGAPVAADGSKPEAGHDHNHFPAGLDPSSATPQQMLAAAGQTSGVDIGSFPAAPDEAREFVELSAADVQALKALMDEFRVAEEGRQYEILDEIEDSYYGRDVLELVKWILESPGNDPVAAEDLKMRAIQLLSGNTSTEIIALMEQAMADPSESVREESVLAVSHLRGPEVVEFIGNAFEDSSQDVRYSALETIEYQTSGNKMKILGKALGSSHADVATAGLGELEVEVSHPAIDVMIGGLESSNSEVVEETRFALEFMFDVEFQTAAEARAWWLQNRNRYDSDLVEKD